jgi:hypothetical protein
MLRCFRFLSDGESSFEDSSRFSSDEPSHWMRKWTVSLLGLEIAAAMFDAFFAMMRGVGAAIFLLQKGEKEEWREDKTKRDRLTKRGNESNTK